MATIEKRGDTYRITVSGGYDIHGKQIKERMTWTPEPGMTARQITKELKRQEVLFEDKCKAQQVHGGNIKLADFTDLWFRDYAEKQLKPRTVEIYQYLRHRTDDALGHIRLDKLQPRHLLAFYSQLEQDNIRQDTKYAPAVDFKAILKERNIKQASLAQSACLGIGTIETVVKGRNVSATSAQKISNALDIPLGKLFSPVGSGTLSGKTRLHYHRFLSAMLETAVQWQYIPSNPCDRVKSPRVEYKETSFLDEKQAVKLISALDTEPILYRTAVLLVLNTGLRRAEVCGLEWADLDMENAVLSIQRNAVYLPGKGITENTPKTKSSRRSIKVPQPCIPMLKEYRAWQSEQRLKAGDLWKSTGRIFTRWDGDPIHLDTLTGWFSDFIKRHDLPHITFHGLRHTNATLLIAAGTNLRTVSSRLGHAQTSTTANIYAHAIQSADAAAAEALGDILSPIKKAQ
ncbi:MAG: tyrosine-type recombinase/integrase [Pseudoflavonifractor sp.]|nr:tyrosine-type recombinase/integrase [Pseudoflavonifractor sp.]